MIHTTALVTAARRYCDENYSNWAVRYAQERTGLDFPGYTYTDNDYDLFPRYNILGAIRAEVETLTAQTFTDLAALRERLIMMGRTATERFRDTSYNDIEAAAVTDERKKFIHFISTITEEELAKEPPLPHRRRIVGDEKNRVMQQLLQRWNYDAGYWDPVAKRSPVEILFLPMESFLPEDLAEAALLAFIRQQFAGREALLNSFPDYQA